MSHFEIDARDKDVDHADGIVRIRIGIEREVWEEYGRAAFSPDEARALAARIIAAAAKAEAKP